MGADMRSRHEKMPRAAAPRSTGVHLSTGGHLSIKLWAILAFAVAFAGPTVPLAAEKPAGAKAEAGTGWAGKWSRLDTGRFNDADLSVSAPSAGRIQFTLGAVCGANQGEVAGSAEVKDGVAVYADAGSGCRLEFWLSGDVIEVKASEGCVYFAGNGVFFHGKYGRGKKPPDPPSLGHLEIWTGKAMEGEFTRVTGADFKLFCETFHLVSEGEDLDGMNAKVLVGGVRGVFLEMQGIVQVAPDGRFWAAVHDPEKDEVRCYSNVYAFGERSSRTVEAWRKKAFPGSLVKYVAATGR